MQVRSIKSWFTLLGGSPRNRVGQEQRPDGLEKVSAGQTSLSPFITSGLKVLPHDPLELSWGEGHIPSRTP